MSGVPAQGVKPQSPYQFATFRWLLGLYLAVHFAALIRWGPELFSDRGVLPDPAVSPLDGLFPNLLTVLDAPAAVQGFLGLLCVAAFAFALGVARPATAVLLWYGWTCLFLRNVLISNPGLPYIGLVLVLCALVPRGEGLSLAGWRARRGWAMPLWLWRAAFVALMAGYSYSGWTKLGSPSWVNGEAMEMLLTGPLARDSLLRGLLLALPEPLLRALAWLALAGELLALPLSLFRRGRPLAWTWMLATHLGIVLVVDSADPTLGMALAHLFVFDPGWLPAREPGVRRVVLFDSVCALCDGSVRFLIGEDRTGLLRFAPLQGETAAREPAVAQLSGRDSVAGDGAGGDRSADQSDRGQSDRGQSAEGRSAAGRSDTDEPAGGADLKSIVYLRGEGRAAEALTRSAAVLAILDDLGGFWRLLSAARIVPAPLRDRLYDLIARHRYRWFGRLEACRLPREGEAERFLD